MTSFDPQAWESAEVDDRAPAPDPGVYEVVVEDVQAFTSNSGNDIVVIGFKIATGPQAGYEWSELRGFKNEGSIKATKATCARLGVDVGSVTNLTELDAALKAAAVGNWYSIEVKQNGEYRNVYVNSKVEAGTTDVPAPKAEEFATAGAPAADEPIPF